MKYLRKNICLLLTLVLVNNSAFSQSKETAQKKCSQSHTVAVELHPDKNAKQKNNKQWKCLPVIKNKWRLNQETVVLE